MDIEPRKLPALISSCKNCPHMHLALYWQHPDEQTTIMAEFIGNFTVICPVIECMCILYEPSKSNEPE